MNTLAGTIVGAYARKAHLQVIVSNATLLTVETKHASIFAYWYKVQSRHASILAYWCTVFIPVTSLEVRFSEPTAIYHYIDDEMSLI